MRKHKDLYRKKRRELRPAPLYRTLVLMAMHFAHVQSSMKRSSRKTVKAVNRLKNSWARLAEISQLPEIEEFPEETPVDIKPGSIKIGGFYA